MKKWYVLIIALLLIAVNIAARYAFVRFDWTRQNRYTISQTTENLLKRVEDVVSVKAYFSKELPPQIMPIRQYLSDMLSEYEAYGGNKFSYEFIDPTGKDELNQEIAKLGIQLVRMQVRENDSLQVKNGYLGLGIFYKDKSVSVPILQEDDLQNLEYTLSSAILKMTLPKLPTIAFLKGHGEHELGADFEIPGIPKEAFQDYSIVARFLRKNAQAITLDFAEGDSLEGVDVLVVAGPRRNLPQRDIFEIDQFLLRGGKAIFLVDTITREASTIFHSILDVNLKTLFEPWGIRIPSQIVMDKLSEFGQFSEGPGQFFVLPYPPFIRLVAQNFSQNPVIAKIQSLVVRFISPIEVTKKEGITVDAFINTSPASWVQDAPFNLSPTDIPVPSKEKLASRAFAVDITGKLPRLSSATAVPILEQYQENAQKELVLKPVASDPQKKNREILSSPTENAHVMIIGDSDLISDEALRQDEIPLIVFLNMVDSLAIGNDLIGIRAKVLTNAPISPLERSEKTIMKILGIVFVPVVIGIYGFFRLWIRRRDEKIEML